MRGLDYGYLIWGVNNKSHKLVGTDFDFHRDVNNEPLEHYLARMLNPDIAFEFKEISINKKRSADNNEYAVQRQDKRRYY